MQKYNDEAAAHQRAQLWWRKATQEQQAPPQVEIAPPTDDLLHEARDIGEELEEEARQKALLTAKEIVIPFNLAPRYRNLRIPYTLTAIIAIVWMATTIYDGSIAQLVRIAIFSLMALLPYLLFSSLEQAKNAGVTLSPQGMEIAYPPQIPLQISWEEIAEIRPYHFLFSRYIAIIPKDTKRLDGHHAETLDAYCRLLHRLGIFVAPINIIVKYLPMTEEDFLAQVNAYRLSHLV